MIKRTIAALLACLAVGCGDTGSVTAPSTTTSPVTTTFASALAYRGAASRAITTSTAGAVKVTLTSFGDGSTVVGLGVGIPATSACTLSRSIVTLPGSEPQLVVAADAGAYCVQLFDVGALTADTAFSLTIEYP